MYYGVTAMAANDRMVGGDHYPKGTGEEHWDRMYRMFGAGYFIGSITKYVERYQSKGGVEDLQKAEHFIAKLIELETTKAVDQTIARHGGMETVTAFTRATGKSKEVSRRKVRVVRKR